MELLSVIRRWHYRDHFSIREISRRTGLSRNTVRKYLRSDSVEPKVQLPDRPSRLDPYADKLSHMLRHEAGKSRKQKRTIKQLHADLVALGYDGSYNRVAAFARDWKAARQLRAKDHRPRRFRALGVHGRRGFPVRLVRGLGGHRGRADQAAGRSLQAQLQPRFLSPRLSAADPRDAVRRPQSRLPRAGRRSAARHLRQYANRRRQDRARERSGGSMRASRPWSATSCSRRSSAIRRPAGRRGRSRRTSRTPAIGFGSRRRAFPLWRR